MGKRMFTDSEDMSYKGTEPNSKLGNYNLNQSMNGGTNNN